MIFQMKTNMQNIYYYIWVDAINYERKKNGEFRNWKIYTLIPISILQGVNLATLIILLTVLNIKIDIIIDFDIFPGYMLDSFLSGIISFQLPFYIINYILIFRKNRYEVLLKKYKDNNGKSYFIYFGLSIGLFILPLFIWKIIVSVW